MTTLAERLIAEREKQGLSQPELAAKAKISQSFIGALETGRQQSSGWLPEIAYALGLQAMWLKTGRGPKFIYEPSGATALIVSEPSNKPHHDRPNVQRVCDLAEQIDDDGLKELAGYARCLTGTHPLIKVKRA